MLGAYGARRPTLAVLGDSYGQYLAAAIQYACALYYAADIHFDTRANASGGRLFSVGGTASSHMLATQLPQFQANPADVAFLWTGYNSTPSSLATAQSEAANITQTAAGCLAAGARLVVIMGQSWRVTANQMHIDMVNTLCSAYARATPGVVFLDITGLLTDPTSVSTTTLPARANYSADGVHPSDRCIREAIAPVLWPVLERVARKRLSRSSINPGAYDPANKPDVNLLGDAGLMTGTSGMLDSVGNAGVAGVSYAKWNIIPVAGMVATPSVVLGADGFLRQRIVFSGAPTAGAYVILQNQPSITTVNNGDSARLFDAEGIVELTGVTGLTDIIMSAGGVTSSSGSGGTSHSANQYPDGTTVGPLLYYGLYPLTISGSNPVVRFTFYFVAGSTPAGYADISRVSCKRVAP